MTEKRILDAEKFFAQLNEGEDVDLQLVVGYILGDQKTGEFTAGDWFDALAGKATVANGIATSLKEHRFLAGLKTDAETGATSIELAEAVTWKGHTYESLTLQVPRGKHMLAASRACKGETDGFEFELQLIAAMAQVHPDVIEALHFSDLQRIRYTGLVMRGKPRPTSKSTGSPGPESSSK